MDNNKLLFSQLERNFLIDCQTNNQYDQMAYKANLSLAKPYTPEQFDDESDEDFDKRWDETAFGHYEEITTDTKEITNYLNRNTSFDLGGLVEDKEVSIKIDHSIEIRLKDGFRTNQLILNGGVNWNDPDVFSFFNLSFVSNHKTLVGDRILKPGLENDLKPLNKIGGIADPEVLIDWELFRALRRRIWFILNTKYNFNIFWIPAIEFATEKEFQLFKSLMYLNLLQIFEWQFVMKIMLHIKTKEDLMKLKHYRDFIVFYNESKEFLETYIGDYSIAVGKELDNSIDNFQQTIGITFPPENEIFGTINQEKYGKLVSVGLKNNLQNMYNDFLDKIDFREVHHRVTNQYAVKNYAEYVELGAFRWE